MSSEIIAKNTSYLTGAAIFQKLLSTVYFLFIANHFGVVEIGKYSFALALTTLFGIFVELGLANVLTREIAKDVSRIGSFVANVNGIKLLTAFITYVALVFFTSFLGYDSMTRNLVLLAGVVMVLDSFHVSFYAVFRGLQKFQYEAMGNIIGQFLLVGTGVLGMYLGLPLAFLVVALILSSSFNFTFSFILLLRNSHLEKLFALDWHVLKTLFSIGYPFIIAAILMRLYGYTDFVLLEHMKGSEAVGYYAVPYKISFALVFIPTVFSGVLYPAFSNYFVNAKERLGVVFSRATGYLMVLAVPLASGIFILSDVILLFIDEKYAPSTTALKILMLSLLFTFLSFPVGALLNACNLQKKQTMMMGIMLFVNVICNIIFIPLWSFNGAALAIVASSAVQFFGPLFYVSRITHYDAKYLASVFFKSLVATSVMGVIIILLKPFIHFSIIIPIAVAVYGLVSFALKTVSSEDLRFAQQVFLKRSKV